MVKILKDCPKGTKLYSPIFGDAFLSEVNEEGNYPIVIVPYPDKETLPFEFEKDGRFFRDFDGECMLFPSREQRDWSKFRKKEPKFDPKSLKAFDKVLFKNENNKWNCAIISHIESDRIYLLAGEYVYYCIPYNECTKHLVRTMEEAPEYYKYWESDS